MDTERIILEVFKKCDPDIGSIKIVTSLVLSKKCKEESNKPIPVVPASENEAFPVVPAPPEESSAEYDRKQKDLLIEKLKKIDKARVVLEYKGATHKGIVLSIDDIYLELDENRKYNQCFKIANIDYLEVEDDN